ncbi:nucleoside 2-deoxyribosyltransferase [bacterium]|nr:nucleoside 2-deoxyribosyltransferase [bacterium]
MNIYFAGSIRGGRSDQMLYMKMINYMKSKGHIVLTEHVGNMSLSLKENGRDKDSEIYTQDISFMKKSDILIAECTTPSLGVGYELAFSEKLNIKSYIFYNKSKTELSAMLTGNPFYTIYPYKDEDEIFKILDQIL